MRVAETDQPFRSTRRLSWNFRQIGAKPSRRPTGSEVLKSTKLYHLNNSEL